MRHKLKIISAGLCLLPFFWACDGAKESASPVDVQVENLLKQMTLREKIGQMNQIGRAHV